MTNTATIILNRNLPKETDTLVEHLKTFDSGYTDIFVVEAGSDNDKLSKYYTWHVNSPDVMNNGLRYSRGMNYGLLQLWKEGEWDKYDYFFLLTNDTQFPKKQSTLRTLQKIMINNPRIGIISPCCDRWSEKNLIGENSLKYFWFLHNNAYFFRKSMLNQLIIFDEPHYKDFIFDGSNFRGYLSEIEIIAKAYANDWAAAITTQIMAEEDETLLAKKNKLIKTESYEENIDLYIDEGLKWAKKKYGFNNRWQMIQYSRLFYEKFFEYFPEEKKYKI